MKLSYFLPVVLVAFFIGFTPLEIFAGENAPAAETSDAATLIVKTELPNQPRISIQSLGDVPTSAVARALHQAQMTDVATVVTSDHPAVMQLTAAAFAKAKNSTKLKFMPMGALTKMTAAAKLEYREYLARANETLRSDKVTLFVLAVTTATDSLVWIHASSLGFPQKLSMVSFNMLMAVTFGLDRDLWGKMTRPVQNRMMAALERLGGTSNFIKASNVLASQFASNLAMGTAFYVLRGGLLSFDQIDTILLSTSFWSHTLKLTTMMTLTQFAWAEVYNKVDADVNPVAKLNLKRISDMRGVILASLASMSMVFQPEVYGNTPVITFAVHGLIGLTALLNVDRVVNLLETSQASNLIYRYSIRLENILKIKSPAPSKCENLFAF